MLGKSVDAEPVHFEGGAWKGFYGFGAEAPTSIEEVEAYLAPQRIDIPVFQTLLNR